MSSNFRSTHVFLGDFAVKQEDPRKQVAANSHHEKFIVSKADSHQFTTQESVAVLNGHES